MRSGVGLLISIALTAAAAAIGTYASVSAPEIYRTLQTPSWSPPSWLFGPVWTVLYLMMAIAAWLVWKNAGMPEARVALGVYVVQLTANVLWSWLFFAWQQRGAATVEIAVLWLLIVATIITFWRIRPAAGLLLVPYLAWVTFASALCSVSGASTRAEQPGNYRIKGNWQHESRTNPICRR